MLLYTIRLFLFFLSCTGKWIRELWWRFCSEYWWFRPLAKRRELSSSQPTIYCSRDYVLGCCCGVVTPRYNAVVDRVTPSWRATEAWLNASRVVAPLSPRQLSTAEIARRHVHTPFGLAFLTRHYRVKYRLGHSNFSSQTVSAGVMNSKRACNVLLILVTIRSFNVVLTAAVHGKHCHLTNHQQALTANSQRY